MANRKLTIVRGSSQATLLTVLSFLGLVTAGDSYADASLKSFAGVYHCPQVMQVKPAMKQMANVKIDVKVEGKKVQLTIKGLNGFHFTSEEMPNGMLPGSFEFRSGGPVQLLSLSELGTSQILSLTYDSAEMALGAVSCKKK